MKELDLARIEEIGKLKYDERLLKAALYYSELGYYVIPLEKGTKKLPKKSYRIDYTDATKDTQKIYEWFHIAKGTFAGWNIGIACGKEDGVFVLDIDVHEGKNGFESLNKENRYDTLPGGPTQETPSGGEHRLFTWQENAVCTSNKLMSGLDTRGGLKDLCKGHIVAWPSVTYSTIPDIEEIHYRWVKGGSLPYIPEWIMDLLGQVWKPSPSYSRGNENVVDDDLEEKLEIEQIQRMLDQVGINDVSYDDWTRIGMSIKSQYPGVEGLTLWGEWSKKGDRYKKGECTIRWEGFSDLGSIRIGTLFYHAKEGGWEPDHAKEDKHYNRYDELVAEMNKEYAIVSIGGRIRVLREKEPMDKLFVHYDLLDKQSFRTLLQNEMIMVKTKGKTKGVGVADIWLGHEHRRTYPGGMGLYPDGKIPNGYYNTWNGFSVKSREGKCELFCRHVKYIICGGNEKYYDWLMDWLADLVQDPSNPKGCAVILKGGEGVGKGIFAETIGELFGPHYRHLIDTSHLISNFNAHLLDSIVVFADEITWGNNKKSAGKLRGMVTERNIIGERKGIDGIPCKNMIHLIMASNEEWVIQAAVDSRRWFVLNVPDIRKGHIEYFKNILEELNNGGREALLYMLLNREVTSILRYAPKTEALQEQRILNLRQNDILNWWTQKLGEEKILLPDESTFDGDKESGNDDWPLKIDKVMLYKDFDAWRISKGANSIPIFLFQKRVSELGISTSKIRVKGGKRKPVYVILPLDESRQFLMDKYGDIFS